LFKLLFYTPRIAPNTGNAIRTAAATGCELHLVEPLGFDLSEPKLRRAGLDYHDLASVTVHASLQAAWDLTWLTQCQGWGCRMLRWLDPDHLVSGSLAHCRSRGWR
jgi:tRNA(Leu) C34 or U34 (ribose-2'-O)-methylase TrmL